MLNELAETIRINAMQSFPFSSIERKIHTAISADINHTQSRDHQLSICSENKSQVFSLYGARS